MERPRRHESAVTIGGAGGIGGEVEHGYGYDKSGGGALTAAAAVSLFPGTGLPWAPLHHPHPQQQRWGWGGSFVSLAARALLAVAVCGATLTWGWQGLTLVMFSA